MPTIGLTGKTIVHATYKIETDAAGHLRHLHYLSGGDGLFAIYTLDEKGDEAMYYIHKDYQGSFETITNHKGTAICEFGSGILLLKSSFVNRYSLFL